MAFIQIPPSFLFFFSFSLHCFCCPTFPPFPPLLMHPHYLSLLASAHPPVFQPLLASLPSFLPIYSPFLPIILAALCSRPVPSSPPSCSLCPPYHFGSLCLITLNLLSTLEISQDYLSFPRSIYFLCSFHMFTSVSPSLQEYCPFTVVGFFHCDSHLKEKVWIISSISVIFRFYLLLLRHLPLLSLSLVHFFF